MTKWFFFSLICCLYSYGVVFAKVKKCHEDCKSPIPFRPVGPTRPWHSKDELGNTLSLTRSYPYSIAGIPVTILKFNITMTVKDSIEANITSLPYEQFYSFVSREKDFFKEKIKKLFFKCDYHTFYIEMVDYPLSEQTLSTPRFNNDELELIAQIKMNTDHNGFNHSTVVTHYSDDIRPTILDRLQSGAYLSEEDNHQLHLSLNRTFEMSNLSSIEAIKDLSVDYPNPYTAFCEIGCSIFYSLPNDKPVELIQCTDRCDELYRYNISVGYNDLAEVARLECRDGCQIALKRCQPGYYCSQVKVIESAEIIKVESNIDDEQVESNIDDEILHYEGGFMEHCPAGMYRDVDYDSVEACIPCPPGRFRETIKGRNLESCSKCPAGTYNRLNGSSTILDCLRCPAGTFTNQPGSEFCICITPDACAKDQLPSPADAEKKGTIPYIGLW
jgi:hypothetical protein